MIRFTLFLLVLATIAPAARSQGNGGSTLATLMPRPADFPTPKTDNLLFFIQRNKNKNTIVYDFNMANGEFVKSKPIDVYWLRYGSGKPVRGELNWLQRTFAFGYNHKKDSTGKGYLITLTAYDGRKIHLEKNSAGKPVATMTINGKYCQLVNIWVYADERSSWPSVFHVDLIGRDMFTGKTEFERIINK